jgi:hypothetical protein
MQESTDRGTPVLAACRDWEKQTQILMRRIDADRREELWRQSQEPDPAPVPDRIQPKSARPGKKRA